MTAKPVPEHISDERLAVRPTEDITIRLDNLAQSLAGEYPPHTLVDLAEAASLIATMRTELQHRREAEAGTRVGTIVDDQYVGPFTKCSCGSTKLELRGKFWCCTKCGVSYGEHAGPAASPSSPASALDALRSIAVGKLTASDAAYVARTTLSALGEHP